MADAKVALPLGRHDQALAARLTKLATEIRM
jgi:hypothetical protein